ncbi:hypothetical protein L3Q82_021029%2C partial [Xyrichtys novacula]|uniref:Inositol monophosphatase 1 n=1 Tax=Xyrichtys novacula TaxID=13765 RepID=A0AAV1GID5_XYRNO|nr:hypothetical protein L3Q82_021029%2C partial [Xyrichtys novacula]
MADWTDCLNFAISISRQASEVVLPAFQQQKDVALKSSPADLVTETDQRVERILIAAIRNKYPAHRFIGEESVAAGEPLELTDSPTWIIDPIDGTVNFVHRFPFVAVSIAFAVNKQVEFGVVYSCVEDKLFHALRGQGAYLNGAPLHASGQEDISRCVVVTEIGAERDDLSLSTMTSNIFRLLQLPVHGVRALGTAAVDMCQVATGGADAYYHIGMHCWDIAASALIVQEAGGVVMDTNGSEFDMMSRRVIAASSLSVANSIAQVIQAFPCRRDDEAPCSSSSFSVSSSDLLRRRSFNMADLWQNAMDHAVSAARKAGEVVREALQADRKVMTKSSSVDLVTQTDQKVERLIIQSVKEKFPSHRFIGEESVAAGEPCVLTDEPTWIIDPIDGTTNFVHAFPFVAVSIGFSVNKQMEFGVVYSCLEDKMFTARRGRGAFCNGQPLQVSDQKDISQSMIATEFGSSREPETVDHIMASLKNVLTIPVHGVREAGTAAVNMCLVASGCVEAYYEIGIHVWDVAAGSLIVSEAGGVLMDVDGGEVDLMSRRVVAANNRIIAERIVKEIDAFSPPRDDAPPPTE